MISVIEVFIARARHPNARPTGLKAPFINHVSTILARLVFIAVCLAVLSPGVVAANEKASSQQMSRNIIRELKDGNEPAPFYEALNKALKKRKTKLDNLCPPSDAVARRILEEYGAIFIANKKVTPPPVCIFTDEAQVTEFQDHAGFDVEVIGFDEVQLQPEAMKKLIKAREEAQKEGLEITPRDGAEAARRNYEDSVRLWNSRFEPALDYWLAQGRLNEEQVTRMRSLPLLQQVAEVLELEKSGVYFSKDLSKSILYSIAAPGTSQHIAMLAFDVNEFENPRIREIMAKHGWFQTVLSDLPHFTFLGLKEKDLPKHGLKSVEVNGQVFWIPNVEGSAHPGLDK
jgi:hypothetical protein